MNSELTKLLGLEPLLPPSRDYIPWHDSQIAYPSVQVTIPEYDDAWDRTIPTTRWGRLRPSGQVEIWNTDLGAFIYIEE